MAGEQIPWVSLVLSFIVIFMTATLAGFVFEIERISILTGLSRCACDVPAHCYSYSWEGNPRWTRAYVSSTELFHYYKGRAAKYGVAEFVKLNHRVTSARWDDGKGKWIMEITNLTSGATITDEAEIFINAAGFLKYVSIFKGK